MISRCIALAALAGSLALVGTAAATAADTLRVGKSVSQVFGYVPLDVGMTYGIFQKHGLEIEEISFAGGTRMAQAMVAGAVDILLSAGPEMALIAKGAPEIAVATITDSPAFMAISVGSQFKGDGIDSLKGRKIGITTSSSLTEWLVAELNRTKGWVGTDRAIAVPVGSPTAAFAGLKIGQIDADVGGPSTGYQLEENRGGRLLIDCSEYVNTIELFTTFASNAILKQNPDAVRRFLQGWMEAVEFMKNHKDETVTVAAKATGFTTGVTGRSYDLQMPGFSVDGKFRQQAIETLRASFVYLETLPEPIDMSSFYTEKYLP